MKSKPEPTKPDRPPQWKNPDLRFHLQQIWDNLPEINQEEIMEMAKSDALSSLSRMTQALERIADRLEHMEWPRVLVVGPEVDPEEITRAITDWLEGHTSEDSPDPDWEQRG